MRIHFTIVAAAAAMFSLVALSAQAAPIAPPKGLRSAGDQVEKVAQGCGRGYYRNRNGKCVRK